jgi:hypothetical protein
MFKVSDKVVCLTDLKKEMDERWKVFFDVFPEKGKVYVVRGVNEFYINNCPLCGLYLVGIQGKNNVSGVEVALNSFDFKLLHEYKNKNRKFNINGDYDYLNPDS